ncbi:MAG TPA: thioredoxin domain-containing protein [Blastocatellia bacterium]|nr:thioredoxin domain-containing protein [Blastocatellia bacterium]
MKRILILILVVAFCATSVGAQAGAAPPSTANNKKGEDCGCDASTDPDLLAIVNGVKLTIKDIEGPAREEIEKIKSQVTEARKRELGMQINSRLLEREAKKRGVSTVKLLESEVVAKVKEPAEAEAQQFYDQNKARIQGEFKEVKDDIIGYLRSQRQREQASSFAARLRAASQVKILVETATPPESDADRARVFATIDGDPVTSADVEDALKPLIFEAQEQIYGLRKKWLDLKINDMLLEQEAQKRKVTARALLEAEVGANPKPVTEEDARKFYDENKQRLQGDFAQLKDQIVQYLADLEQRNRETAFAERLKKGASFEVFLREPEPPVYSIATDDQPSKGSPQAQVTIVEFTDFECPSCARTQPILDELIKEYGDRIRLVVRDFPLAQHANAASAALAAEAAREQGKYWEYIAILFQNQSALGVDRLKEYASRLGLDTKRFDEALDSGKHAEKVQRDLNDGYRIGINSTPTVFINGQRVREKTRDALKAAIEAALKVAAKK